MQHSPSCHVPMNQGHGKVFRVLLLMRLKMMLKAYLSKNPWPQWEAAFASIHYRQLPMHPPIGPLGQAFNVPAQARETHSIPSPQQDVDRQFPVAFWLLGRNARSRSRYDHSATPAGLCFNNCWPQRHHACRGVSATGQQGSGWRRFAR